MGNPEGNSSGLMAFAMQLYAFDSILASNALSCIPHNQQPKHIPRKKMKTNTTQILRRAAIIASAIAATLMSTSCTREKVVNAPPLPVNATIVPPPMQSTGDMQVEQGPPGPEDMDMAVLEPGPGYGPPPTGAQRPPQTVARRQTLRTGPVRANGGPPTEIQEYTRVGKGYGKYLIGEDGKLVKVASVSLNDPDAVRSMIASGRKPVTDDMEPVHESEVPDDAKARIQAQYQKMVNQQRSSAPPRRQQRR